MNEKQMSAIDRLIEEGNNGMTIERAVEILKPHANIKKAIRRERRTMARRILRSLQFIPYKKDSSFVYIPADKLEAEHLHDVQSRRIKPARTMVRNAVKIAISVAKQSNLFAEHESFIELESMKEEFLNAAQVLEKEMERVKKSRLISSKSEKNTLAKRAAS